MVKDCCSQELFEIAQQLMVGGVNSPVRSFKYVGGNPIYIKSGKGPYIISVEGRKFIDYVLGWGTFIFGHCDEEIKEAIKNQLENGIHFGACHPLEIEFAYLVKEAFKNIDKIRIVNSGTEAVMVALRLAKAFTGKKKIIKFAGNYHGHFDQLLIKSGSGVATFLSENSFVSIPQAGVPEEFTKDTIVIEYNDESALEKAFEQYKNEIAAVIVEPIAGNMGVVLPKNGFLKKLREITQYYQSVLIFDEVITGFRFEFGGLSNQYNPDITILGKIVGGGLPIGVVAGKKEIMDLLAPVGEVYQGGTFSANPLTLAAATTTLKKLKKSNYHYLEELSQILTEGIVTIKNKYNKKLKINKYGSMISIFFTDKEVENYQDTQNIDKLMFQKFFKFLLEKGIYLPPSPFEALFISFSHTTKEINYTIDVIEEFFIN